MNIRKIYIHFTHFFSRRGIGADLRNPKKGWFYAITISFVVAVSFCSVGVYVFVKNVSTNMYEEDVQETAFQTTLGKERVQRVVDKYEQQVAEFELKYDILPEVPRVREGVLRDVESDEDDGRVVAEEEMMTEEIPLVHS